MFLPCDAYHCWGQAVGAYASHMKSGSRRGQMVLPTFGTSIRHLQGTVHVSPGLFLYSLPPYRESQTHPQAAQVLSQIF